MLGWFLFYLVKKLDHSKPIYLRRVIMYLWICGTFKSAPLITKNNSFTNRKLSHLRKGPSILRNCQKFANLRISDLQNLFADHSPFPFDAKIPSSCSVLPPPPLYCPCLYLTLTFTVGWRADGHDLNSLCSNMHAKHCIVIGQEWDTTSAMLCKDIALFYSWLCKDRLAAIKIMSGLHNWAFQWIFLVCQDFYDP